MVPSFSHQVGIVPSVSDLLLQHLRLSSHGCIGGRANSVTVEAKRKGDPGAPRCQESRATITLTLCPIALPL